MTVVLLAMLVMVLLAVAVMGAVAVPQLREGKTVFTQGGLDQVDAARRRAAAVAGGAFGKDRPETADTVLPTRTGVASRLRVPLGWNEQQPAPRHAR